MKEKKLLYFCKTLSKGRRHRDPPATALGVYQWKGDYPVPTIVALVRYIDGSIAFVSLEPQSAVIQGDLID
ncbi:hypothetical protein TB1_025664 [Malus domestica]